MRIRGQTLTIMVDRNLKYFQNDQQFFQSVDPAPWEKHSGEALSTDTRHQEGRRFDSEAALCGYSHKDIHIRKISSSKLDVGLSGNGSLSFYVAL